jgi:hypothetical protein
MPSSETPDLCWSIDKLCDEKNLIKRKKNGPNWWQYIIFSCIELRKEIENLLLLPSHNPKQVQN